MSNFNVSLSASGLIKREEYSYEIIGLGGNWPAIAIPQIGFFVATSKTAVVNTTVSFLPSVALANNSNTLDYDLSTCGFKDDKIFTNVRVKITSLSDGSVIYSSPQLIECVDCLPDITINFAGCTAPIDCNQYILTNDDTFSFTSILGGLEPNTTYNYTISSTFSNWPTMMITPITGSFTTLYDAYLLKHKLKFCPTSSPCASSNMLSYALPQYIDKDNLYTNIQISISPQNCNNQILVSNNIAINCKNCLPQIGLSFTDCSTAATVCNEEVLSISNKYDFLSNISGLETGKSYTYSINSPRSNWPLIITTPSNGSFVANSSNHTLKHKTMFCPYTNFDLCGNYINSGLVVDSCPVSGTKNWYADLTVSVMDEYSRVFSKSVSLLCNDCIPSVTPSLPATISLTSSNMTSITGNITNLTPGRLYNYLIECTDSNWPSILRPASGSFIANNTTQAISSKIMFCYPSGKCPPGTPDLLAYSLDTTIDKDFNNNKLYTDLILNITSECGDDVDSSVCRIQCSDCLPCVKYASVIFSGSPLITLPSGCCEEQKLIYVNVSNAVPGDKYSYEFDYVLTDQNSSLSFTPSTGEIYFGTNGTGKIYSVIDSNLVDYAQALLKISLTHNDTSTVVHDTVGIVCRSGLCVS